jgi:hypothetical protein
MTEHVPPRGLVDYSAAYRIQRETRPVLRCVNGCDSPRRSPFTTCHKCRSKIWKLGAQKAARVRKRMLKARESAA